MEGLFAQVQRRGQRLTLLYFDLDDFKRINDAHGHAAGDKILKGVAQTLILNSRRNENLYRLGGDEFAILIADVEQHQIETLAQRVISSIDHLQFSFAEHQVHIHCSMGIAAYAPGMRPESAMELLQQADIAMYQAKHLGKNRWYFYNPAHPLDLGKDSR
jgi:diguanylate cyclase (GGDEF)-like protein